MAIISALEAETHFADLLERVCRGEEIVIMRDEKPIARLIPEGDAARVQIRETFNELASLRAELTSRGTRPLTGKDIRDAIRKGRS